MIYLFHLHSLLCLLGCSAHSVSDFCSPSILAFFYNPPSFPDLFHNACAFFFFFFFKFFFN